MDGTHIAFQVWVPTRKGVQPGGVYKINVSTPAQARPGIGYLACSLTWSPSVF